uniref:RNA helicase n=1 Tax=Aceria tosichella TaxID=561515 RepID=A0A6G1SKI6_9ACAR
MVNHIGPSTIKMAEPKLTMANYGDHELFGPRIETNKLIQSLKTGNDSECILFPINTFESKEQYRLKDLIYTDKRLSQMVQGLDIEHALPIQRYSWPKIDKSSFPNLFVSAEATGKTYAILMYAVAKCLAVARISEVEEVLNGCSACYVTSTGPANPDDYISHPKYLIVCSSQDNVELVHRTIDHMKEKIYDERVTSSKRRSLTPISRALKLDHDNDKLAQRCIEADILISSPQVLIKALELGYINFAKFKKIFFDDLDIALQLQNSYIRELIKIYLIQTQAQTNSDNASTNASCQMHLFSRKWTDLVKQFLSSIFPQRTILFGSVAEAAVYSNVRFEVECCETNKLDKISVISNLLKQPLSDRSTMRDKAAIVCKTDEEAELVSSKLNNKGIKVKLIKEAEEETFCSAPPRGRSSSRRNINDMIFVISDPALEFEVEFSPRRRPLNDFMHLIHASLPDDMLTFDQRFRLLYVNIQDGKSGMTSTVIVDANSSFRMARQIYDLASRSPVTLKSTKCLLRSLIPNHGNQICWRWATTGLCRLEKLSRNDRFGSYCSDRHVIDRPAGTNGKSDNMNRHGWPESGMVKISITHIISPSEFYFLFEAYKTKDDGKWVKFKSSGTEYMKIVQHELNSLRNVQIRSIPLNRIVKGMIYGVYFPQEARVDRVLILDEPKHEGAHSMVNKDLEYSKQIPVFKVDHGVCLDVYIKNLIELPEALAKIPGQCHRGFHLGYKPPDNEPNWLYKSKKHFYDIVCVNQVQQITAWIRLNCEGCIWFEGMLVSRKLTNIDSNDTWTVDPYEEMRNLKLAEPINTEPPVLPASIRLETLCRWNHAKLIEAGQYAFIRRDLTSSDIFLLIVHQNLDVIVRQSTYNKQLIELEQQFVDEFKSGKLLPQEYLATGVYCIAKIEGDPSSSSEPCLNRVKILWIQAQEGENDNIESPNSAREASIFVECLDHGDKFWVTKSKLYQASIAHLKKLPFQAIKCKLANLNKDLLSNDNHKVRNQLMNKLYDFARDETNVNLVLKCKLREDGRIYLYVPNKDQTCYEPLYKLVRDHLQLELHDKLDDVCQETIKPDPDVNESDGRSFVVDLCKLRLLREIVVEELNEAQSK